jgi:hypothetical protein
MADLHILSPSEYKNVVFGMLPACMYVCLPEWDGLYSYLVFKSLSFLGLCLAMLGGSPVTTAWHVLKLRMEHQPPDVEGRCKYIE